MTESSPNWAYGYVPTPGEWNYAFQVKQDALGFTPLNIGGGTMTGKLDLAPSTTSTAGVNAGIGAAPGVPVVGDIWITTAGMYYQTTSGTIGPLASQMSLASYTIGTLPAGSPGQIAYASDAQVSGEGPGAGTGSIVSFNGVAWQIAGTNVTAEAESPAAAGASAGFAWAVGFTPVTTSVTIDAPGIYWCQAGNITITLGPTAPINGFVIIGDATGLSNPNITIVGTINGLSSIILNAPYQTRWLSPTGTNIWGIVS